MSSFFWCAVVLVGRLYVVSGTRRALKEDMLPTLPSDDADRDPSESMLEERDRPLLSLVLSFGATAVVSAFRETFGTPQSPQLSSAARLTGRALNWLRFASSSASCSRSARLFTLGSLRRNEEKLGVLGSVSFGGALSLFTGVLPRQPLRSIFDMRSRKGSSPSEAVLLLRSLLRVRPESFGDCGTVSSLVDRAVVPPTALGSIAFFKRASPSLRRFLRFSTASSASRIWASSVFMAEDWRERDEERRVGDFGTVSFLAEAEPMDWRLRECRLPVLRRPTDEVEPSPSTTRLRERDDVANLGLWGTVRREGEGAAEGRRRDALVLQLEDRAIEHEVGRSRDGEAAASAWIREDCIVMGSRPERRQAKHREVRPRNTAAGN